jgi:hypothetical protein
MVFWHQLGTKREKRTDYIELDCDLRFTNFW